jgi:tRNA/tmRNA/rRNA uracil-C5-methylase (TrmA/RlmC/RlmD family)
VVAIESDRRACDNLVKSARDLVGARRKGRSKEPAIHIAQGRAESIFREIVDEFAPTLVVANPPRSGLHAEVRSALGSSESIRRIVMISCDPSTCVRDMKELMSAGFVPEPAVLLDCYPQTPHMEIVLAMERP